MAAPRKYPEELRERAIRLAIDLVHREPAFSVNAACKRVGEQLASMPTRCGTGCSKRWSTPLPDPA